MERMRQSLRKLSDGPEDGGFDAELARRLTAEYQKRALSPPKRRWPWLVASAAAVFLVAGVWEALLERSPPTMLVAPEPVRPAASREVPALESGPEIAPVPPQPVDETVSAPERAAPSPEPPSPVVTKRPPPRARARPPVVRPPALRVDPTSVPSPSSAVAESPAPEGSATPTDAPHPRLEIDLDRAIVGPRSPSAPSRAERPTVPELAAEPSRPSRARVPSRGSDIVGTGSGLNDPRDGRSIDGSRSRSRAPSRR